MSENKTWSDARILMSDAFKSAGYFLEMEKIADTYSHWGASSLDANSANSAHAPITESVKPWMARVGRRLVTGHGGDYGIQKVWDEGIRGQGVTVGVNDDGMVLGHVDFDYAKVDSDGYLFTPINQPAGRDAFYRHGTAVAGVIGARADGMGLVGIAHECDLWPADFTSFEFAKPAIAAGCDVLNNSWGVRDAAMATQFASRVAYSTEFDKAAEGRNGLGMSLVFTAGNYRTKNADTAVHVTTNHENVMAIAAVDINTDITPFSTPGEAVHVAALGRACVMIDADDLSGNSLILGSGTSYAAPVVSGVVALMYQANPGLGLRDVQEILAYSASLPNTGMLNFSANAGTHSNGGGLHFSRDHGFGLVNAYKAVRLAQSWFEGGFLAATARNREQIEIDPYRRLNASRQQSTLKFNVAEHRETEHVKLRLDIDVSAINDLKLVLSSPSGTESVLMDNFSMRNSALNSIIDLGSRRFWGEDGAGDWTLSVSSVRSLNVLRSAKLILSGDADTTNDRYIYTDEFDLLAAVDARRLSLRDSDGGNDTFNASAVTRNAVIDLRSGAFTFGTPTMGHIEAGSIIENVVAGDGNDVVTGQDQVKNSLHGGNGDDTLDGGFGVDTLVGGRGNDIYVADDIGEVVIEKTGEGMDVLMSYVVHSALHDNVENLLLMGPQCLSGKGNALSNMIVGNLNDNSLIGGGGNDTLSGGDGDDELDGCSGADVLLGGKGNDIYFVDAAGDVVSEQENEGIDTVQSSLSYVLAANLEELILTGLERINGTGNAENNVISGNLADNFLDGAGGADSLAGGQGNDVYTVDSALDVVTEKVGEGTDQICSSVALSLADNVEVLVLTGAAAIWGAGNALDNLIRGNENGNGLGGGYGTDVLEGGGGHDILNDTEGRALFNGGDGNDRIFGADETELYLGGLGDDTSVTGMGKDIILFNKGDGQDTLVMSGSGKTLSLGGRFAYGDLTLSQSGGDLVLQMGALDQITFKSWYTSPAIQAVVNLQVIAEAMSGFGQGGDAPFLDHKVENFSLAGLVGAFDAARVADITLSNWGLNDALSDFHLTGSNSSAIGGDLAYQYGKEGSLAGVGLLAAQMIIFDRGFGDQAQPLQSPERLQNGTMMLMD
jgi:Ca2+-binding RTX toxin-like protein